MQLYQSKKTGISKILVSCFNGSIRSVPAVITSKGYRIDISSEFVESHKTNTPVLRIYKGTKLITALTKGMYIVISNDLPPMRATQAQLEAHYEPITIKSTYELQPLKWDIQRPFMAHTVSPLHEYSIRYSDEERCYLTTYYEFSTQESGVHRSSTLDAAMDWSENTHLPSKLLNWFVLIN